MPQEHPLECDILYPKLPALGEHQRLLYARLCALPILTENRCSAVLQVK
jgi:hypothetical protein